MRGEVLKLRDWAHKRAEELRTGRFGGGAFLQDGSFDYGMGTITERTRQEVIKEFEQLANRPQPDDL